jgi:hypothetical protein
MHRVTKQDIAIKAHFSFTSSVVTTINIPPARQRTLSAYNTNNKLPNDQDKVFKTSMAVPDLNASPQKTSQLYSVRRIISTIFIYELLNMFVKIIALIQGSTLYTFK